MGVDFTCDTKSFSCSYGGWAIIRNKLVKATFDYLDDFFAQQNFAEKSYESTASANLKKWINEVREYANQQSKTPQVKFGMDFGLLNAENFLMDGLLLHISANEWFGELLIEFGVAGIYALCQKSGTEGFYSVGNSYDIFDLLIKVRPFLLFTEIDAESSENIIYERTRELEEMFQESAEKKIIVRIH